MHTHRSSISARTTAGRAAAIATALALVVVGVVASGPDTAAAAADCRAIPVEADGPLGTAEVREAFGVDGTGVTVGIISDSFGWDTTITSPEDDIALGVLPGPGNPCGYEQPVEIVSDSGVGGRTDEGRAMAQLVHGIAPGARILFADRGDGAGGIAEAITALAEAGARIIVDDVSDAQEPFYQPGVISVAIERAQTEFGVTYLTSAGNENTVGSTDAASAGRPIASWETVAYRPIDCPAWIELDDDLDAIDCLDFSPDGAGDATSTIQLNELDEDHPLQLATSWGDAVDGLSSEFVLQVYAPGDDPELLASSDSAGEGLPVSILEVPGPIAEGPLDLVIVRTVAPEDEEAPLPAVRWQQTLGSGYLWDVEYFESTDTDTVGPVTYGHQADGRSLTVGAAPWTAPEDLHESSSIGPATLIYAPVRDDGTPAEPLDEPVIAHAPQIVAVDGTRTSFFGEPDPQGDETHHRFFGTSAAAPNAAAVLALALEYAPDLTRGELTELVVTTGLSIDNPYAEFGIADEDVVGGGLISAPRLFEALPVPPAPGTIPAAPAASALTPTTQGGLVADPVTVTAGETVVVEGLPEHAWVFGYAYSTPVALGWGRTGGAGAATFRIPVGTANGAHRLAVLDADGALLGWVAITVVGGRDPLTPTGGDGASGTLAGLALLAAGGIALATIARRGREQRRGSAPTPR